LFRAPVKVRAGNSCTTCGSSASAETLRCLVPGSSRALACPLRRLAAMLLQKGKVRDGEGACATQNESRFQRWDFAIVRIPGALPQVWNDSRAVGAKRTLSAWLMPLADLMV